MSRIPLQTLPMFRAVARLSNLRAAAEQLHLTHSAISQQMRVLEEQLGFALFDRRGRRVVLNAAGAALLSAVEPALAQIDEGVRAAALAASGTEQSLRLTALPSFAQHSQCCAKDGRAVRRKLCSVPLAASAAARTPSSICASAGSTALSSAAPAAFSTTRRPRRSNRANPSCSSSTRICWLMALCVKCSCSAAARRLDSRATARNVGKV